MPSTPRMIELERKASTPGEGLSRDEVSEWHRENETIDYSIHPVRFLWPRISTGLSGLKGADFTPPDYTAANRYLDAPGLKERP